MRGFTGTALAPLLGTLMSFSADIMELDVTFKGFGNGVKNVNNSDDAKTILASPWWGNKNDDEQKDGFNMERGGKGYHDLFERPMKRFGSIHEHHLLLNAIENGSEKQNQKSIILDEEPSEVLAMSVETMCNPLMMYNWKLAVPDSNNTSSSSDFQHFGDASQMGTLNCDISLVTTTFWNEKQEEDNERSSLNTNVSTHSKRFYHGALELANVSCEEEIIVVVSALMPQIPESKNSNILRYDPKQNSLKFEHELKLDQCTIHSKDNEFKDPTRRDLSHTPSRHNRKIQYESKEGDALRKEPHSNAGRRKNEHVIEVPHVAIHPSFTSQLPQTWTWTDMQDNGHAANDSWNSIRVLLPLTYTYPQIDQLQSRVHDLTYKQENSDRLTIAVGFFTFIVVCFHITIAKRLVQHVNVSNKIKEKQVVSASSKFSKVIELCWKCRISLQTYRDEAIFYLCAWGVHRSLIIFDHGKSVFNTAGAKKCVALKEFGGVLRFVFGSGFMSKVWKYFLDAPSVCYQNAPLLYKAEKSKNVVQPDNLEEENEHQSDNLTIKLKEDIIEEGEPYTQGSSANTETADLTYQVSVAGNLMLDDDDDDEDDQDLHGDVKSNAEKAATGNTSNVVLPEPRLKDERPLPKIYDALKLIEEMEDPDNNLLAPVDEEKDGEDNRSESIADVASFKPAGAQHITENLQARSTMEQKNSESSPLSKNAKTGEDKIVERTREDPQSCKPPMTQSTVVHDRKRREDVPKKQQHQEETITVIDPNVRKTPNPFVAEMLAKSDIICKRKVKSPPEVIDAASPVAKLTHHGRSSPRRRLFDSDDKTTTRGTSVLSRTKAFEQKCFKSTSTPVSNTPKSSLKRGSSNKAGQIFREVNTTPVESDDFSLPSKMHNKEKEKNQDDGRSVYSVPSEEACPTSDKEGLTANILMKTSFDDGVLQDKRLSFLNEYW